MHKSCLACKSELKKSATKYCSNKCQKDVEYNGYIERWKNGEEKGQRGITTGNFSAHIIRYIREKYENKCVQCGWSMVNQHTNRSPLEIDHIDGNADNTSESNLTLLCPNCHALTSTYKNANNGRGRLWRKQKYMLK